MADRRTHDRRGVDPPFPSTSSFHDSIPRAAPHPQPPPRQHDDDEAPPPFFADRPGHKAVPSRLQMLAPPFLRRGDSAPATPLLFRLSSLEFKQLSPSQPKPHWAPPFAAPESRRGSPRSTGVFFGNVNSNHPVNVININVTLDRKRSVGDDQRRPQPQQQPRPSGDSGEPAPGGYDRNSCCGVDIAQLVRMLISISTAAALL